MARKLKTKYDSELQSMVTMVDSREDLIKDYKVERVANKGDNFITQNIHYNVLEIEADYDFPVYKYIHEGKEYFSNFKFANYVEIINPETIN